MQLKGRLTTQRYNSAMVFVDHYSRLQYIHLMTAMTLKQTIEAKIAFERFAKEHGVQIKHYHADNGHFADNAFKQHCETSHQTLTFCGVNAHFQNGNTRHHQERTYHVASRQGPMAGCSAFKPLAVCTADGCARPQYSARLARWHIAFGAILRHQCWF
jgi:uncharacterized protein with PIN domain